MMRIIKTEEIMFMRSMKKPDGAMMRTHARKSINKDMTRP